MSIEMEDGKPKPAPGGVREITFVVVAGAYLLLTALMVSNAVPVRSYIESHSNAGVLAAAMQNAMHLPYLDRVRIKMVEAGFSEADTGAKLNFLAASFVTMLSLYAISAGAGAVVLLIQGIRRDPATIRLSKFSASQHIPMIPFLGIILGGACLGFWAATHGLGRLVTADVSTQYVDSIVVDDFSIGRSMLLFTVALLLMLFVIRVLLCYVGLAINAFADLL